MLAPRCVCTSVRQAAPQGSGTGSVDMPEPRGGGSSTYSLRSRGGYRAGGSTRPNGTGVAQTCRPPWRCPLASQLSNGSRTTFGGDGSMFARLSCGRWNRSSCPVPTLPQPPRAGPEGVGTSPTSGGWQVRAPARGMAVPGRVDRGTYSASEGWARRGITGLRVACDSNGWPAPLATGNGHMLLVPSESTARRMLGQAADSSSRGAVRRAHRAGDEAQTWWAAYAAEKLRADGRPVELALQEALSARGFDHGAPAALPPRAHLMLLLQLIRGLPSLAH